MSSGFSPDRSPKLEAGTTLMTKRLFFLHDLGFFV